MNHHIQAQPFVEPKDGARLRPCPVTGCPARIPRHLLMCHTHWQAVPKEIKNRLQIEKAKKYLSPEHRQWIRVALHAVSPEEVAA